MLQDALEPSHPSARIERHAVMHERGRITAPVLAVEQDQGERIGPGVRTSLAVKNLSDADFIGIAAWPALYEQRANFAHEIRRRDFVGVDVEKPDVLALLLGEPLLRPITR